MKEKRQWEDVSRNESKDDKMRHSQRYEECGTVEGERPTRFARVIEI